jgi:hypothetical protein
MVLLLDPNRPAACPLDAGKQLRLGCQPAAAVMTHPGQDVAQRPGPPSGVRLIDHLHLAAAVALDVQEPRGERGERLVAGLGTGRERLVAVAPPVPRGRDLGGHDRLRGRASPRLHGGRGLAGMSRRATPMKSRSSVSRRSPRRGLSRDVTTKSVRSLPQFEQRNRSCVSGTSPRPASTRRCSSASA